MAHSDSVSLGSKPFSSWPWKAISLGILDVAFLIAFTTGLICSVTYQKWIGAQICLVGVIVVLGISAWQLRRMTILHAATALHQDTSDYGVATIIRLLQFTGFGAAAILIYAMQKDHWVDGTVAEIAGVGLLTAGASLAAGAFVGFLFGVPKSSQPSPSENASAKSSVSSSESKSQDDDDKQPYGANTNLEQISDWLTKTIVGVTLVELYKLPPYLAKLAAFVAPSLDGDLAPTKAVALVIMVYFAATGFLTAYLWTRMELTRAFNASAFGRRLGKLEKQSKMDAAALVNVDRWINHPGESLQSDAQLMDSIRAASSLVKARIFLSTQEFREKPAPSDQIAIRKASDLTLPIFQALVESDTDRIFHRNRSQFAFALMTKSVPDWQKALETLEEAIAIRDRGKEPGWKEYEFARAICKIKLNTLAKAKSDSALKASIDADLQALPPDSDKRQRLDLDGAATAWQAA
jgi:hypothetical protein